MESERGVGVMGRGSLRRRGGPGPHPPEPYYVVSEIARSAIIAL